MIKLTERDYQIIDFLKNVKVAYTNTINILFFNSLRACQSRLKKLVDGKYIRCFRPNKFSQNIYYIGIRCSNWKHKIIFSNLIGKLKELDIEVIKYVTPIKISSIIADGFIAIKKNDINQIYLVEVELTKYFNVKKYEDLYYNRGYKEKFPVMPGILVITDKNIDTNAKLNIKKSKLDLTDLKL